MKQKHWFMLFLAFFIFMVLNAVIPPTQAEVERFLNGDKYYCYPSSIEDQFEDGYYCTYALRRQTTMVLGQISRIPIWWILPNFMLYVYTPFHYFTYIDPNTNEWYSYVSIKTLDKGKIVYNPLTKGYLGSYDALKEKSLTMKESGDIMQRSSGRLE